jgi:hypothetical protein
MTVLVPTALALLAIALPITVLYILKLRMRQVHVSSDLFWQQIFQARPPRSFWNRFRHPLSWLTQILILLTIVGAAADPRWLSGVPQRNLVIILDTSASMQARESSGQRLTLAANQARQIINGLPPGTQAAVIAADQHPEVICGMTDHMPDLLRAISRIQPSAAPGRPALAVTAASEMLGNTSSGSILLLTDGCFDQSVLKNRPELTIKSVAAELPNVGITGCQALRNPDDPLSAELLVSISNASPFFAAASLELRLSGTLSNVTRLTLAPGENTSQSFPRIGPVGGTWQAQLKDIRFTAQATSAETAPLDSPDFADALELDNSAVAVLPDAPRQKVLLVSPGNLFVQKVLEADPLIELSVLQQLPADNNWPRNSIVILHELVPPQLPPLPLLVLDPRSNCDAWNLRGTRENPLPAQTVTTHPVTRNFRLDDVLIPAVSELEFNTSPQILAAAEDGLPLCSLLPRSNGPVVIVPLQLTQSDLAFRTVFPILISNSLNWLAGRTESVPSAIQAGQRSMVLLPPGSSQPPRSSVPTQQLALLQSPSGIISRIPVITDRETNHARTAVTGPLREAGLWLVDAAATPAGPQQISDRAAHIAVNVAAPEETDLRPRISPQSETDSAKVFTAAAGRPPWYWLCLAAVLLLTCEWFLCQRRWIS